MLLTQTSQASVNITVIRISIVSLMIETELKDIFTKIDYRLERIE